MNRFKKMTKNKLVDLLSAHILRFPIVGVLLKHITDFPDKVYGQEADEAILENIKKLLRGLRWKEEK